MKVVKVSVVIIVNLLKPILMLVKLELCWNFSHHTVY